MNYVDWILLVVSVLLTAIVALQHSKGDLSEAITGSNSELFKNQKERGAELFLSRGTAILTVLLVALTLLRNFV